MPVTIPITARAVSAIAIEGTCVSNQLTAGPGTLRPGNEHTRSHPPTRDEVEGSLASGGALV